MSPKGPMWMQAGCLALALMVLAITPEFWVAIALSAALALCWLVLDVFYARALGPWSRSDRRRHGDRQVTHQTLLVCAVGLAAGLIGAAGRDMRLWHDPLLTACCVAVATLFLIVYVSSLIDWYGIRPRRDGVVCDPPCRSSRQEIWCRVTRRWFFHRALAQLLTVVAILVATTMLTIAILRAVDQSSVAAVVAMEGVVLACISMLMVHAVSTLRGEVVDPPDYWIGDRLMSKADGTWMYVVGLTVSTLVVRTWDDETATFHAPESLTLDGIEQRGLVATEFSGCAGGCCGVNKDCEWQATDRTARLRSRRLVL